MTPLRPRPGRASAALTATYLAGPSAGFAAGLFAAGYRSASLIMALVAVALALSALAWALKQENRR